MALRVLHQEPYITISYDYVNEWLYAEWIGDQNLESVQTGCLMMLQYLKSERCHKVLNDNRLVTSMWADAAEWGGYFWFPAMAEGGLEYFAWVYSPNIYSRLSTDLTLQHTTRPVILTFDNIETASSWLKQV
ncbi:hypothetical protein SAMN06265337_3168 [Hymenobacter gelipurpurascens]|uniref:SpoIIAA-like n=1 Tax=Hymenobacter gelipurpurascens TaxID=89968 RepID=A0A212UCV4_9BACT|nr:hypothetical protein [Hymenobacter gelipurpurascens]SNC76013.1 hypothetical protein SAMN06265337_3168 [Hymenobacter gelipurpurascens]